MKKTSAIFAAAIFTITLGAFFGATKVEAHSWYKYKTDPVYHNSCCGGQDCAMWAILPGELSAEANGLRVRLSLERSRMINPYSQYPIDAVVIWDRVQPSEDGNWHLCVMTAYRGDDRGGIYCLFAPPNG